VATGRVFVRKVMGGLRLTKDGWWVPRTAELESELQAVQVCASQKLFAHRAPHWHGEVRPADVVTVLPRSAWPEQQLLRELSELGYPVGVLLCAAINGHSPVASATGDRRKLKGSGHVRQTWDNGNGTALIDVEHPYIPAAPGKRTTHSSVITKQQFLTASAPMRLGSQKTRAAFEVVVLGRPVPTVAKRHRLKRRTLEATAYRVRKRAKQCFAA
jgi:hypothetical protein